MITTRRPRIVVLGGGYAGTMAAARLSAADADVTLVNPRPHFVERIRLHQQVARTGSARRDYTDLLPDSVALVVDTAVRIDTAGGQVDLAAGRSLAYDHLVYAVGSTGAVADSIDGADEHALTIGEWEAAQRLSRHLGARVNDPSAVVTVVGGGLTGVETAGELAAGGRVVRLVCRDDLVASLGERARTSALRQLVALGVDVLTQTGVEAVTGDTVTIVDTDGTRRLLPSAATVLAAGFGVPDLAATSGLSVDPLGRMITDETLTSVDDPRIVAAGDASAPSGVPFRMSCQAATQLGPHAADTVLAQLRGTRPEPVVVAFAGQCVSIGRRAATIGLTRRDDTPRTTIVEGRAAAAVKELICRSTVWRMRMEARHPGRFPAVPGQPRALPVQTGAGVGR